MNKKLIDKGRVNEAKRTAFDLIRIGYSGKVF